MTYLEWNNAIAGYFFCSQHAEQFIYLYADKEIIERIGLENGKFHSKKVVWEDFLQAVKTGLPGSPKTDDLLKKAIYTYKYWKKKPVKLGETEITYPLYIAYLVLFVLPLTDSIYSSNRSSEYYPRFEKFAQKWGLRKLNYQHESYNWNDLWKDLEHWSFQIKNMDLGVFEDRDYSNKNWKYAGKALAQCLLPLKALKNLGNFFQSVGLTPKENISRSKIRHLLIHHKCKSFLLQQNVTKALKVEGDEKGETVIDIVMREYEKWQGNTDVKGGKNGEVSKGWTIARIYTLMEIEDGWNESVKFSYRIFSQNDFPEDLNFNGIECIAQTGNWSKPLILKEDFFTNLQLHDDYNKWNAKLPEKSVRIFISGTRHNLNGWVETDYLIPGRRMYLLAKEEIKEDILTWQPAPDELDLLEEYEGIPEKYVLFRVCNPKKSHSSLEELTLLSELSLQLIGGLPVARRAWLDVLLPCVLIEGAPIDTQVFVEFKDSGKRISLSKKNEDDPIWLLPDDLPVSTEFYIKVGGQSIRGDHLPYQLIDHEWCPFHFSENYLPKRDRFGDLIEGEATIYATGSHVNGMKYNRQYIYNHTFTPVTNLRETFYSQNPVPSFVSNLLIYYLTIKMRASTEEYFKAFENLLNYFRISPDDLDNCPSIANLKRTSLQMLDYLGFLDYEYSNRKIVVNPPQLIFIPTKAGRKLILIGGRTPKLLESIILKAKEYNFIPIVEPQHESNTWYFLPDRVVIVVPEATRDRDIIQFAKDCNLVLKENPSSSFARFEYSQFGLIEFSGRIENLEKNMKPDSQFPGDGWICKIFNPDKLCFERALENEIDHAFQLVEYKVNEYTFLHRLWKNGKSYPVNKNWGRYLVLKDFGKQVIFYDNDTGLFAVPSNVPLPRLMMEGIMLCSGFVPVKVWLKIEEYETYWHIFDNVPSNLVYNEFQKIGQKLRETKIPYKHEEPHRLV
jgi:hypothetical protein